MIQIVIFIFFCCICDVTIFHDACRKIHTGVYVNLNIIFFFCCYFLKKHIIPICVKVTISFVWWKGISSLYIYVEIHLFVHEFCPPYKNEDYIKSHLHNASRKYEFMYLKSDIFLVYNSLIFPNWLRYEFFKYDWLVCWWSACSCKLWFLTANETENLKNRHPITWLASFCGFRSKEARFLSRFHHSVYLYNFFFFLYLRTSSFHRSAARAFVTDLKMTWSKVTFQFWY